jgi:DNA-binding IclR family transcriptional regulator
VPRPSPQTDRVIAVINLLTDRGDHGCTLTELAAHVGQTPSALVHVLASLSAAGYVVRRPSDRRYRLGRGLIAPGQVALGRVPELDRMGAVVTRLARRTGHPVFAFARDGDYARLVETGWDRRGPARWMRIGDLLPIDPPLGASFVAWNGDAAVEEWLRRVANPSTRQALRERLSVARELGFVVELRPPMQVMDEITRLAARGQHLRRAERMPSQLNEAEQYIAGPLKSSASYQLAALSVPVCRPSGVELAINVVGFDRPLTGRQVVKLGRIIRAAADQLAAAEAESSSSEDSAN